MKAALTTIALLVSVTMISGCDYLNSLLYDTTAPSSVVVTAPVSGAELTTGVAVTLTVSAVDDESGISSITFYVNGSIVETVLIAEAERVRGASERSISWTPPAAGNYSIDAKAVNAFEMETTTVGTTNTVSVTVVDPPPSAP